MFQRLLAGLLLVLALALALLWMKDPSGAFEPAIVFVTTLAAIASHFSMNTQANPIPRKRLALALAIAAFTLVSVYANLVVAIEDYALSDFSSRLKYFSITLIFHILAVTILWTITIAGCNFVRRKINEAKRAALKKSNAGGNSVNTDTSRLHHNKQKSRRRRG